MAPSGLRTNGLAPPVAFVARVMSLFFMTATAEQSAAQREAPRETAKAPQSLLARLAWPTLGLVLPVTLAVGWEIAVGLGLSSGRLLPPPSVIFDTFLDLAST